MSVIYSNAGHRELNDRRDETSMVPGAQHTNTSHHDMPEEAKKQQQRRED